jgi:hypothetical protein
LRLANKYCDVCSRFVQQGRGFECALPTPDDQNAPPREPAEIAVLRCMRREIRRQSIELCWPATKLRNARGDDYARRLYLLAIIQMDAKFSIFFDSLD